MKKIALVVVYFGAMPEWMNLYVETCRWNSTIDWLIFSEKELPLKNSKNVKSIRLTRIELSRLVREKLGVSITVTNPYKLNDFKPAYGVLFEDYLRAYDFWGHVDLDALWGDIRSILTEALLERFQIISAHVHGLCGHFTLFKNEKYINTLFTRHPRYKEIFEDEAWRSFDEGGMAEIVRDLVRGKKLEYLGGGFVLDCCAGYWKKGKIFNACSHKEMLYLHFHKWKRGWRFFRNITLHPEKIVQLEFSAKGFKIRYPSANVYAPNFPEVLYARLISPLRFIKRKFFIKKVKAKCNIPGH